jgi:hypothetical protein
MKTNEDVKLAFRRDLEIVKSNSSDGAVKYYVKEPRSENVIAFEEEEYFICMQLDGRTSLLEIKSGFENQFNIGLDINQLQAFVHQLGGEGFLKGYTAESKSIVNSLISSFQHPSPEKWKKWNLFSPHKMMMWLARYFKWCYTRTFVLLSVVIFLLAIGVLYNNFNEFLIDLKYRFVPLTLFQVLAVFFICINIPYKIVKGMTTVHFKGYANEFGIHLIFDFIPLFYCNCELWNVKEKSHRNWILFASTYCAILFASMGMLCWKMTSPALALHTLGLTISVMGTISAIAFLNFLWPTDIAHLLSNWLEIPNLRERSIEVWQSWLFMRPLPEPLTSREKKIFGIYGTLAGIVTVISVGVAVYFVSKLLILKLAGIGGVILLLLFMIKYRKTFLQRFYQKEVVQDDYSA